MFQEVFLFAYILFGFTHAGSVLYAVVTPWWGGGEMHTGEAITYSPWWRCSRGMEDRNVTNAWTCQELDSDAFEAFQSGSCSISATEQRDHIYTVRGIVITTGAVSAFAGFVGLILAFVGKKLQRAGDDGNSNRHVFSVVGPWSASFLFLLALTSTGFAAASIGVSIKTFRDYLYCNGDVCDFMKTVYGGSCTVTFYNSAYVFFVTTVLPLVNMVIAAFLICTSCGVCLTGREKAKRRSARRAEKAKRREQRQSGAAAAAAGGRRRDYSSSSSSSGSSAEEMRRHPRQSAGAGAASGAGPSSAGAPPRPNTNPNPQQQHQQQRPPQPQSPPQPQTQQQSLQPQQSQSQIRPMSPTGGPGSNSVNNLNVPSSAFNSGPYPPPPQPGTFGAPPPSLPGRSQSPSNHRSQSVGGNNEDANNGAHQRPPPPPPPPHSPNGGMHRDPSVSRSPSRLGGGESQLHPRFPTVGSGRGPSAAEVSSPMPSHSQRRYDEANSFAYPQQQQQSPRGPSAPMPMGPQFVTPNVRAGPLLGGGLGGHSSARPAGPPPVDPAALSSARRRGGGRSASPASSPPDGYEPPANGDWVWDLDSQMFWSQQEYLFLNPRDGHFFDPDSQHWYNPDTETWYPAHAS